MEAFQYRDGELYAEGVAVRDLAEEHGTPLYIYSRTYLRESMAALKEATDMITGDIRRTSLAFARILNAINKAEGNE